MCAEVIVKINVVNFFETQEIRGLELTERFFACAQTIYVIHTKAYLFLHRR